MKNWGRIIVGIAALLAISGSIYAQAPAATPPAATNHWEKSAALGLTLTKGNSDTLLVTADFLAARKMPKDEFTFGLNGSYGENDGEKNNEAAKAFGQWNHLFTEHFYSFTRLDALYDAIADVDYRVTLSVGPGYYLIKNETTRLSVEAGPGYVIERQGDRERDYATVRLAQRFEHKFGTRGRIWESVEILPELEDFNNYIVNAEIGVEAALTPKLSLRLVAQNTYDNEPAKDRKRNDLKLISGIVLKF